MDIIQIVSNKCAISLATKVTNDKFPSIEDQVEVYQYGFQVILGGIVKAILLISIASILGILSTVLILALTFSSLRIIAGGIHLKTFLMCVIVSLLFFVGGALIVQYTYQYWTYINIYCLLIFSTLMALYIIIRYVPRDTPNKPITEQIQINKFKRWSLFYMLGWTVLMITFLLLNIKIIVIASCFGLLLELFSISRLGYSTYELLNLKE